MNDLNLKVLERLKGIGKINDRINANWSLGDRPGN